MAFAIVAIANLESPPSPYSMTVSRRFWRMWIAAKANRIAICLRQFLVTISIFAAALTAPRAFADQDDAFNIGVGGTVSHDSNLFRTPDSAGSISDTIHRRYVGLYIDKPYAQQRFQLDATETAYRYEKSSDLDFDGLNYRGAWLWHLGPRISGKLEADRSESLVQFEDTTDKGRNVRVTENRIFNVNGELATRWHLYLGVGQSKQTSEQPSQAEPDFESVDAEAGVTYLTPLANSITFVQRLINGNYLNTIFDPTNSTNDDYRQYESELEANWVLNAKSALTGRLRWIDRHNDNLSQRDFSGLAGRLGYGWTPTAKVAVNFAVHRDIVPWQDDTDTSYKVDNVLSVAPTWEVSAKFAVRMRLEHVQSYYHGGAVLAGSGETRRDTTDNVLLGVGWTPLRSLSVGASMERQRRSSNNALADYSATVATISASLKF